MIEVKRIKAEETYALRKEVLRKNIDLPSNFKGDTGEDTFHLGLFIDHQLIGIVSFMKNNYRNLNGEHYQLRGMATNEEFQGKGYGKELILYGMDILKDRKANIVWCNARVIALDFYKKMGFQIIGEEFDIPKIGGHFVMYKKL